MDVNYPVYTPIRKRSSRRKGLILIAAIVFALIVAGIILAVILTRPKSARSASSSSPSSQATSGPDGPNRPPRPAGATSGGSGSTVTKDDGNTFVYINNFDGDWIDDPAKPFAPGGRAQSWSPRVGNETWVWGQHLARGVNLG
jgi:glucan 1,3-beta-glucosidase